MPGITVGVDGSHNGHRALDWAMREAVLRQVPLTVPASLDGLPRGCHGSCSSRPSVPPSVYAPHAEGVPGRQVGQANPGLVLNDGADVVHPVRFTAATGSLPGLDRVAAALADFPCGMSEVIFPRMPVAFAEVSTRKSLALLRNEALLRCISGGHLHSLGQTPSHDGLRYPAWHRLCDEQTSSVGPAMQP